MTQEDQAIPNDPTRRQHLVHLEKRAAQQNASLSCGRVLHVGHDTSGGNHVEYIVSGGGGYVSDWPSWAFELAKEALLHDKEICVISNGDPLGNNLVGVYLEPEPMPS
jgi:hypothetical protein